MWQVWFRFVCGAKCGGNPTRDTDTGLSTSNNIAIALGSGNGDQTTIFDFMSRINDRDSPSTPSQPDRSQSAFRHVDEEQEPLEFDLEKELIVAFGSAEAGSSRAAASSSKAIGGSEVGELDEEEEEEGEDEDGAERISGVDDVIMAIHEDGHGPPTERGGQDDQHPSHHRSSRSPLFLPRSSSDPLAIDSPSPSRSPSFELLDDPGSSASATPRLWESTSIPRRERRRRLMPFVEIPLLPLRTLREYALLPPATHPTSQSRQRLFLSPSQSPSPSDESDFEIISPDLRHRTMRNKAMRTRLGAGAGATVHTRADTRTRTQTRTRGRARSGTSDQLMSDGSKEFGGYGSEDEDEEDGSGTEDSEAGNDEMMLRRSKRATRAAARTGKREELDRTRTRTRAVARRSVSTDI